MSTTNLSLKVVAYKLEGVEKGMDRRQLNLLRRFFLPRAVDDRSKDFVCAKGEDFRFLQEKTFSVALESYFMGLTIDSQIKPIVCRVAMRRLTFVWVLTKPSNISMRSPH